MRGQNVSNVMFNFKDNLKYKAVIFDFDYTLADSSRGVYESVCHALNKMGYSCPEYEEVCKTIGLHLSRTFAVLTGNENDEDAVRFMAYFKEKADQIMSEKTIVFDEVEPAFEYFASKGIKRAIVSTKFRYRIKDVLDRNGLAHLVDVIIGGEDVKKPKPDPEGLEKAIAYLGLSKEDCLFVGDSLVDAGTAKNAQVDFIATLTGTTARTEFEEYEPLYIIKNLSEMKKIFVETC